MAKIRQIFEGVLKDEIQRSDEMRDKIHAEEKWKKEETEKTAERVKAESDK